MLTEKRSLSTHIELLTDKLLIKSGYGQLRPVAVQSQAEHEPRRGRVTSPSEAISRTKEAEAEKLPIQMRRPEQVPPSVKSSFLRDAAKVAG